MQIKYELDDAIIERSSEMQEIEKEKMKTRHDEF